MFTCWKQQSARTHLIRWVDVRPHGGHQADRNHRFIGYRDSESITSRRGGGTNIIQPTAAAIPRRTYSTFRAFALFPPAHLAPFLHLYSTAHTSHAPRAQLPSGLETIGNSGPDVCSNFTHWSAWRRPAIWAPLMQVHIDTTHVGDHSAVLPPSGMIRHRPSRCGCSHPIQPRLAGDVLS